MLLLESRLLAWVLQMYFAPCSLIYEQLHQCLQYASHTLIHKSCVVHSRVWCCWKYYVINKSSVGYLIGDYWCLGHCFKCRGNCLALGGPELCFLFYMPVSGQVQTRWPGFAASKTFHLVTVEACVAEKLTTRTPDLESLSLNKLVLCYFQLEQISCLWAGIFHQFHLYYTIGKPLIILIRPLTTSPRCNLFSPFNLPETNLSTSVAVNSSKVSNSKTFEAQYLLSRMIQPGEQICTTAWIFYIVNTLLMCLLISNTFEEARLNREGGLIQFSKDGISSP